MIGNRIKAARLYRDKTQTWLAEEVGVTQPSVFKWEKGTSDPSTNNLASIAIALNVRFEWLAKGEGEMEPSYLNPEIRVAQPSPIDVEFEMLKSLYEQLPRKKRQILLQFMSEWLESK